MWAFLLRDIIHFTSANGISTDQNGSHHDTNYLHEKVGVNDLCWVGQSRRLEGKQTYYYHPLCVKHLHFIQTAALCGIPTLIAILSFSHAHDSDLSGEKSNVKKLRYLILLNDTNLNIWNLLRQCGIFFSGLSHYVSSILDLHNASNWNGGVGDINEICLSDKSTFDDQGVFEFTTDSDWSL